ncbi:MAG: enoyl-ACP reductase [Armatimonadetes bacterium]|nr:enoyl-ACP reductase [Armatimonadota bacterium]
MLDGKVGLICNVANQRSAAWAIAKACDAHGAKLVIGYLGEREKEQLDKLLGQLRQEPVVVSCDVTDDDALDNLRAVVEQQHGKLDFLVHSLAYARMEDLNQRFIETSRDGFLLAQNISAYSLAALTRVCEPLFSEAASVVCLSYIGAVRAMPNYNVMGVAKASLEATVRYLASELGPAGVRVNAISAGPMRTLAASAVGDFKALHKHVAERSPLRHSTTQEEVADTTVFLVSNMARGITGDVIYVDSGYHILGV